MRSLGVVSFESGSASGKVFVKEKAGWYERGVWVVDDAIGEVAVGCVEDDGGDVVMVGGECDGE